MKAFRFLVTLFLACEAVVLSARRPNIIFILCDDLGYGDLGVTGHPYVKSPNIDGLARDGVQFTEAYMSGAWCAPSRSALMSGLYPARYFNATHELDVDRPSLTSVLKEAGYATVHYGKWHMGPRKGGHTPDEYGIDEALITNGTGPTWPAERRKDPRYRENTTEGYVDLAIEFMSRKPEKPFFMNLWVYPTHSYIDPTPEMLAVYKDLKVDIADFENPLQREFLEFVAEHGDVQDATRAYCADVTELDAQLGRLLQSLEDLGLAENTIVIFSSDNGPGPLCGNWDNIAKRYKEKPMLLNNVGSAGPYRDRKISLHDGGIHAPFFARWPARIKAGSVNKETIFGGVDLLPTLATIVSAKTPEGLDGEDLSAAWLGEQRKRSAPLYWNDKPGWSALRDGEWKAHMRAGEFHLYDLSEDPSESNDVARKNPEKAKRYSNMLKQWEASLPKGKK